LVLARQENNIQVEVDILNHIAYTMQIQSNYEESRKFAQQAFKLAQQHGYDLGVATGLTISAYTVFHFQANYQEALGYFKEALAIYRQLGHAVGIAGVLRDLGILANTQGDYLSAIRYLSECLVIDHQIGTQSGISATLNNLGLSLLHSGQFASAHQHLENALLIRLTIGDQRGIAATFHNLGLLVFYEEDYGLAEEYHQNALTIREKIKHPWGIAESFHNLANIARYKENFEQAVDYYTQSLEIYQRIKDQSGIIKTLLGQTTLQFQRGQTIPHLTIQENLRLAQQFGVPTYMLIALVHHGGWQCQQGKTAATELLWGWLTNQSHYDGTVRQHAEALAKTLAIPLSALPAVPPTHFNSLEEAVVQSLQELGAVR
jgi:tetratricopeptide (TPR) repeat protein